MFIDEIDTIGKKRDGGGLGGNDEREQTLNQLLTEMDGFDGTKGVVILAATTGRNRSTRRCCARAGLTGASRCSCPTCRDASRSSRCMPRMSSCPAILILIQLRVRPRVHRGADLANIINEAALRAVRMGRRAVEQADLEESVETVIAGAQRKNAVLSAREKEIVAYHEIRPCAGRRQAE